MGRVVFRGPTVGYKFTDTDVEWLARSMWGEEEADDIEGKIAVAWTHINRFLLVNYKWRQEGWPFYKYVQGHSQPINPAWRRDGRFCRPGGKYHGSPKYCSEAQLRKRDKFQTSPVPQKWLDLAERFANGEIPNPFDEPTYDFAADWLVRRQNRPCDGIIMGKAPYNAHLTYECLKPDEKEDVISGEVKIDAAVSDLIPKGAAVILALPVGYVLYRILERIYEKYFK